ncbi:hypothetical protein V6436_004146 [Vibrio vulnificus]
MDSKPVWHNPGWITAIVALVSAFLTLPEVIGSYVSKQQDIELAKQTTEAARLGNLESKQEQEFRIVQNTLAQQGTERVFVLRYLAHTLDDENAKRWAEKEVTRLDDLAVRQEELDKAKHEFESKRREVEKQQDGNTAKAELLLKELNELQRDLDKKNAEINQIQSQAGIRDTAPQSTVFVIQKKENYEGEGNAVAIDFGGYGSICYFNDSGFCLRSEPIKPPNAFDIAEFSDIDTDVDMVGSISVYDSSNHDQKVVYQCSILLLGQEEKYRCVRDVKIDVKS